LNRAIDWIWVLILLLLVLLPACSPEDPAPPLPDVGDEVRGVPQATVPPPTYRSPGAPVRTDNAQRVEYLGRLDIPTERPSSIFAHAFSPDGTQLAAFNRDSLVSWDLLSGRLLYNISRDDATRLYFSDDKVELYTLNQAGDVSIYDAARGNLIARFQGLDAYNGTHAFYTDAGWLAMAAEDGRIQVWDARTRESQVTLTTDGPVDALAFSGDGSLLATGTRDGLLQVWDWRQRRSLARYDHRGASIRQVVFAPDDGALVSGTPTYIAVWTLDAGDDSLRYSLEVGQGGTDALLRFSPDGRYLVSGGSNAPLAIWDPVNGESVALIEEISGSRISVAFSPTGDLMLTSVLGGGVSLWNMTQISGETIQQAPLDVPSTRISAVGWSDTGFSLALFDAGGSVYLWGIDAARAGS